MDTQKSHMMSEEEKCLFNSQERKIYPLTGDLIWKADQDLLDNWDKGIEEARQSRLAREAAQKSQVSETTLPQGEIPHLN